MKASGPHKFQDSFGSLHSTFRIDPKTAFYSGILFLIFPFLFFIGLILKQYLQIDFLILTVVYEWTIESDRKYGDVSLLNWLLRFLILGGPLIAVFLNALAWIGFRNRPKTFVNYKWLNLLILLSGLLLSIGFMTYLIIENLPLS